MQLEGVKAEGMKAMILCLGKCDEVPEEVCDAVFASLKTIPGVDDDQRDARAAELAPRMAAEGWRFCRCFPMRRTQQHEMIFRLVHTNLANHLAHKAELTMTASMANSR